MRKRSKRRPDKARTGKNSFKPILVRLDKFDRRINLLDKKVGMFRQETAREFKKVRQETAIEFKKVRQETAREFKKVRKETAVEFIKFRREVKQEIHSVRTDMTKYYLAARDENRMIANEHARTLNKMLTTMDTMAKQYTH